MAWDIIKGKSTAGQWGRDESSQSGIDIPIEHFAKKVPWKWVIGVGAAVLVLPQILKNMKKHHEKRVIRARFHEGFPHEETVVDIRRPSNAELFARGMPGRRITT